MASRVEGRDEACGATVCHFIVHSHRRIPTVSIDQSRVTRLQTRLVVRIGTHTRHAHAACTRTHPHPAHAARIRPRKHHAHALIQLYASLLTYTHRGCQLIVRVSQASSRRSSWDLKVVSGVVPEVVSGPESRLGSRIGGRLGTSESSQMSSRRSSLNPKGN